MKNLDEFKDESLEMNEQLASQGGLVKNDNSGRIANSEATQITTAHPQGEDVNITYANDDRSIGDTEKIRHIYPD
jgi:hypothetical protein